MHTVQHKLHTYNIHKLHTTYISYIHMSNDLSTYQYEYQYAAAYTINQSTKTTK